MISAVRSFCVLAAARGTSAFLSNKTSPLRASTTMTDFARTDGTPPGPRSADWSGAVGLAGSARTASKSSVFGLVFFFFAGAAIALVARQQSRAVHSRHWQRMLKDRGNFIGRTVR